MVAEWLESLFPEVEPLDYYSQLFPEELLEEKGVFETGKYCGIAISIKDDGTAFRTSITRGLPELEKLIDKDVFTMTAPCLFAGKQATIKNARWLTAIEFDLDYLRMEKGEMVGQEDLLFQIGLHKKPCPERRRIPCPTYLIASSARNLHVVYLLDKPIPMYPANVRAVREFRQGFIRRLWDSYITDGYKKPQYETSPVQAFRLVGSKSKDKQRKVRCFQTGGRLTIDDLNEFGDAQKGKPYKLEALQGNSRHTLEDAKELYPEWYEKRVVQGIRPGGWKCHRGLYDWWLDKAPEIQVGHRYHYLMCLAAYAQKCGISDEELEKDVMRIREFMDVDSPKDNPLTVADAKKALQAHTESYRRLRRETISRLCGVEIPQQKRNGRPQELHMALLNGTNNIKRQLGEQIGGSKSKKDLVIEYRREHPEASIRETAKDLEVSTRTVQKWIKYGKEEGLL